MDLSEAAAKSSASMLMHADASASNVQVVQAAGKAVTLKFKQLVVYLAGLLVWLDYHKEVRQADVCGRVAWGTVHG